MTAEEADYLVVGAGAMGLAFADDLVAGDRRARVTIVDRRAKPGGHWNDAYPFVRLHQPAAFYGVNSEKLGTGGSDLSSRSELLAYFERALQRLTATGRVSFLPATEHLGEGRVRSTVAGGREAEIRVGRKIVDATYMDVQVPATHPPLFEVDPSVDLIPPNELVRLTEPRSRYAVVGSGKTGGDAVNYLLDRGVEPGAIRWISPSDMWMWNREVVQPRNVGREMIAQLEAVVAGESVEQVFLSLEERGSISRLDPEVTPAKWRCATFDRREREQLRQVGDVVRAGRVTRITGAEIELDRGSVPLEPGALVVNCTANGLAARAPAPIFGADQIRLQSVFQCQQVFSAALLGRLEAKGLDPDELNAEVSPVPHPELVTDFPGVAVTSLANTVNLARRIPLWLYRSRVHALSHVSTPQFLRVGLRAQKLLPAAEEAAERLTGFRPAVPAGT